MNTWDMMFIGTVAAFFWVSAVKIVFLLTEIRDELRKKGKP